MEPFSTIGTVLQGAGALGSIFGGGGQDAIDVSENIRLQKHSFDQTMNSAAKHGLHPLFALGAGMGQSPSFGRIGGGEKDNGAAVAQLGEVMQKLGNKDQNKVLEALGLREAQASVRYNEARAGMAEFELEKLRKGLLDNPTAAALAVDKMGRLPVQKASKPLPKDLIKPKVPEVALSRSGDASATPGKNPAWRWAVLAEVNGHKIGAWVPYSDEGIFEGMEGILPGIATLAKNAFEGGRFTNNKLYKLEREIQQLIERKLKLKAPRRGRYSTGGGF